MFSERIPSMLGEDKASSYSKRIKMHIRFNSEGEHAPPLLASRFVSQGCTVSVDSLPTGNRKKLSKSQACCLSQLCLTAAQFLSISCGTNYLRALYRVGLKMLSQVLNTTAQLKCCLAVDFSSAAEKYASTFRNLLLVFFANLEKHKAALEVLERNRHVSARETMAWKIQLYISAQRYTYWLEL